MNFPHWGMKKVFSILFYSILCLLDCCKCIRHPQNKKKILCSITQRKCKTFIVSDATVSYSLQLSIYIISRAVANQPNFPLYSTCSTSYYQWFPTSGQSSQESHEALTAVRLWNCEDVKMRFARLFLFVYVYLESKCTLINMTISSYHVKVANNWMSDKNKKPWYMTLCKWKCICHVSWLFISFYQT